MGLPTDQDVAHAEGSARVTVIEQRCVVCDGHRHDREAGVTPNDTSLRRDESTPSMSPWINIGGEPTDRREWNAVGLEEPIGSRLSQSGHDEDVGESQRRRVRIGPPVA